MSDQLIHLSVERVITLHNRIMTRMGVAPAPLRSLALLESAVLRPQQLAYYKGADIAEQAVTLAVGISQNQPFLDGNKRTAFIAMEAFLEMNGFRIEAKPLDIAVRLEAVANRAGSLEEATQAFADWLRERLVPLGEGSTPQPWRDPPS